MATAVEPKPTHSTPSGRARIAAEERRARPVKYWATLGAICLALQAWVYGQWIMSADFKATPKGPDPVPGWMKFGIHAGEALSLIGLVISVYFFVVRPWRRERRLSLNAIFMFAFLTLWWQDLLMNYIQPMGVYNAEFFNRGNWSVHIPGWTSPGGSQIVEPLLMVGPFYVYACFGATVLGCWIMRKAKERWPHLGRLGLMTVAFAFFCVFDFIIEPLVILRLGWWAWPGTVKSLTIFQGEYYQFPLYGMVLIAATWTAWTSLLFFKNDKGQTVVERGLDQLRVSPRKKTAIRFLAITGCLNAMFLIYFIPVQAFTLNADPWPKAFETRSYLTNGVCGPRTTYACPGPDTPIPRRHSPHLDPNGNLVTPGK